MTSARLTKYTITVAILAQGTRQAAAFYASLIDAGSCPTADLMFLYGMFA